MESVFDNFPTVAYVFIYIFAAAHVFSFGVFGADADDDLEDGRYRNMPLGGLIIIGASLPMAVAAWAYGEELPIPFLIFFAFGIVQFVISDLVISAKEMADGAEAISLQCGYIGVLFAMLGHALSQYNDRLPELFGFDMPQPVPGIVMMVGLCGLVVSAVIAALIDDRNSAACVLCGLRMAMPLIGYFIILAVRSGFSTATPVLYLTIGALFLCGAVCALVRTFKKLFHR